MRTVNRLFLGGLITIALAWTATYVVDLVHQREDRAFYRTRVAPSLNPNTTPYDPKPLAEWLQRINRRSDNAMLGDALYLGGAALALGWMILALIQTELFWKRRNSAARSADPEAGAVTRELRNLGSSVVARASKDGLHFLPFHERNVQVDFARRTVTFRGFRFVAHFAGNRRRSELTLPFTEILGGRIWTNHGHRTLNLRTTAGTVVIFDDVRPFEPLVTALLDLAEVNRQDPAAFAASLAREPKIKIPWYGWLILVAAMAALAVLANFLWRLPAK